MKKEIKLVLEGRPKGKLGPRKVAFYDPEDSD